MGLLRRIEPPRTFTPEEAQQWHKLQDSIVDPPPVVVDVELANMLFVDVDGDDGTAVRESLVFKYATIQAALNAAQAGDVVKVGPGVFAGAVWPDTENVSLVGAGGFSTLIQGALNTNTIWVAPATAAIQNLRIADLSIVANGGANFAVIIDASAQPTSFSSGGAYLERLRLYNTVGPGGIQLETVNHVEVLDVEATDLLVTTIQASRVKIDNLHCFRLATDFDPAAVPQPSEPRVAMIVTNSSFNNEIIVNNISWVRCDSTCEMGGVSGDLIDTATMHGMVEVRGRVVGEVILSHLFDDGAGPVYAVDFDDADIGAEFSVNDNGSTIRCTATARNSIFRTALAQSILAGNLTDMDLRGAVFDQEALAIDGNGAIDRSVWTQLIAAGNTGVAVPWSNAGGLAPVPYVSAPESVAVESGDIADLPIAVTAKTAAAVTCSKTLDNSVHIVTAFKDV